MPEYDKLQTQGIFQGYWKYYTEIWELNNKKYEVDFVYKNNQIIPIVSRYYGKTGRLPRGFNELTGVPI